jgi:hypothetical protein
MAEPYRTAQDRPGIVRGRGEVVGVRVKVKCRGCGGGSCHQCNGTGREDATVDLDAFIALITANAPAKEIK